MQVPDFELAREIHQMFSTPNMDVQKQYMDKFAELEKNPIELFPRVLTLLKTPGAAFLQSGLTTTENETSTIKMSLSVYLKNVSSSCLKSQTQAVGQIREPESPVIGQILQVMCTLSQEYSVALVCPDMEAKYKYNLSMVLMRYLAFVQQLSLARPDVFDNLIQILADLITQALPNQNSVNSMTGAIHLTECIILSIDRNRLEVAFDKLSANLKFIADAFLSNFRQYQQELAQHQGEMAADAPLAVNLTNTLEILGNWARMCERVLERSKHSKHYTLDHFLRSQTFSHTLIELLNVTTNVHIQGAQIQSIVNVSGLQKIDQQINQLKTKVILCITTLISHLFSKGLDEDNISHFSPIFNKVLQVSPILVNSCAAFTSLPNLEELSADESMSELIVSLLQLLSDVSEHALFFDMFSSNKVVIIVTICLNLLKTTTTEFNLIQTDPSEFVNLALDTCDKQQSETMKTQAAKLIESMCDNIDGSVICVVSFCTNALNYILSDKQQILTSEGLWGVPNDPFLTNSPPSIIAETCLVAFTILSYTLPKREDLVPYFQESLANNIDKLLIRDQYFINGGKNAADLSAQNMQGQSVIIRARMSLLLGYYADMLFTQHSEAFNKTISFLMESMNYMKDSPEHVIALQSIDTLNTIVSDKELAPRLQPLIEGIVKIICTQIGFLESPTYFEFVREFVKHFAGQLNDKVVLIFQAAVNRIQKEQQIKQNTGEASPVLGKCWNIIRFIIGNSNFMPTYYAELESQILPLFEYIVEPSQIEFEDDILLSIKTLIKKKKSVSENIWRMIQFFPKVLEKNKHSFGNILDTINNLVLIGRDFLKTQPDALAIFLTMADTAMFSEQGQTRASTLSNNIEGAILVQLLLQVFEGTEALHSGLFEQMMMMTTKRIQKVEADVQSGVWKGDEKILMTLKKHLVGVFLSATIYSVDATIAFLNNNQALSGVLQELFNLQTQFKHEYERRLFGLGLSNLVAVGHLWPAEIQPRMLDGVKSLLAVIKAKQDSEKQVARKEGQSEINVNDNGDDSDDDSDFDSDDESDDMADDYDDEDEEPVIGEPTENTSNGSHQAVDGGSTKVNEFTGQNGEESKTQKTTNGHSKKNKDPESLSNLMAGVGDEDLEEVLFDLNVTLDILQHPQSKLGIVSHFCEQLRLLSQRSPQLLQQGILNQLDPDQKRFIGEMYGAKEIQVGNNQGQTKTVSRSIISVKRRGQAAAIKNMQNQDRKPDENLE